MRHFKVPVDKKRYAYKFMTVEPCDQRDEIMIEGSQPWEDEDSNQLATLESEMAAAEEER